MCLLMASKQPEDRDKDKLCKPIKSVSGLEDFIKDPPKWINSICDLILRSPDVVKYNGTGKCHYDPTKPIYQKRYNRNYVPKTLLCHDFKNGYLQDSFVEGCLYDENGYVFNKWSNIDIFVYFSHHLITIPPLGWINLAHKNGVNILGTFITEWDAGKAFWNSIINDKLSTTEIEKNIHKLSWDLAQLMFLLKLDGWLINIENPIEKPEYLLLFVKHLTNFSHEVSSGSIIIWYDSVTESGELKWQNELNAKNRCYFDVCDGIFLNYNWSAEGLRRSAVAAQHRHLDVYAGVDVFGRGCYGNGRFHSYLAARETREANVSMALFAPGWTHETLPLTEDSNRLELVVERFLHRDNAFWRSMGPFLFTHPITRPFFTTFNNGVNATRFDLSKQDFVLSRIPHSKLRTHEEELNVETLLRWPCDCVQLHHDHASGRSVVELVGGREGRVHRLLACNIPVIPSNPLTLITVYERLPDNDNALLRVVITAENGRSGFRRQFLYSKDEQIAGNEKSIVLSRCRYMNEVEASGDLPPHYRCNAYNLDIDCDKIVDISMEVITGSRILLRAFGVIESKEIHTD